MWTWLKRKWQNRRTNWYLTGESTYRVEKEMEEYRYLWLYEKAVNFETGESRWFRAVPGFRRGPFSRIERKTVTGHWEKAF